MTGLLLRASLSGAVGVVLVWTMCRLLPRLSATVKAWLWFAAAARFIVALSGHCRFRFRSCRQPRRPSRHMSLVSAAARLHVDAGGGERRSHRQRPPVAEPRETAVDCIGHRTARRLDPRHGGGGGHRARPLASRATSRATVGGRVP